MFCVQNRTIFAPEETLFLFNLIMYKLERMGSVPFDVGVLSSLFPNQKHIVAKARALERSGAIIRLKKGLYVANMEGSGSPLCRELIANHLYGPSYVGGVYALRYYGLIPETVHSVTSFTTKHSRCFQNPTGIYQYRNCWDDYFHLGIRMETINGMSFLIASKEKALCDVINFSKNLKLRFLKDVEQYLEYDIRFDIDELDNMDIGLLEKIAAVSRRTLSINSLIKYLRHDRHI